MINKIVPKSLFNFLGITISAFSLFNFYLRVTESGISVVFDDLIEFYRIIADFLFGWALLYLPSWLPSWLGELWLLSFALTLIFIKGHKDATLFLAPERFTKLLRFKLVSLMLRIWQFFLYGFTFYSIFLVVFGPLLLLLTTKYQNKEWWNKIISKNNHHERQIAFVKMIRSEKLDDGVVAMVHTIAVLLKAYSALVIAIIFYAMNAYGVSVT